MTTAMQAGQVYRYLRTDADHDVSTDVLELTLDGATWSSTGVTYIAPGDRTPKMIAADAETPPANGLTGYWWRIFTGPSTDWALPAGDVTIRGRLTDNPETPHFRWDITVSYDE